VKHFVHPACWDKMQILVMWVFQTFLQQKLHHLGIFWTQQFKHKGYRLSVLSYKLHYCKFWTMHCTSRLFRGKLAYLYISLSSDRDFKIASSQDCRNFEIAAFTIVRPFPKVSNDDLFKCLNFKIMSMFRFVLKMKYWGRSWLRTEQAMGTWSCSYALKMTN